MAEPEHTQRLPTAPDDADAMREALTGTFLWLSLRRAFRLEIDPKEVLVQERAALEAMPVRVMEPGHQAFLAWRRSVLLLIAIIFVPLTVLRVREVWSGPPMTPGARVMVFLPALAEALFCITCFAQLRRWTQWASQRRALFIAWMLYFLAPFVVYLFPFREAYDSWSAMKTATAIGERHVASVRGALPLLVGLATGVQSLLVLGPKIVSLMPGIIRASIVTKLLFPGTTAPGWLMVLAAPLYALLVYVIILLPYQITGSWQFVAGNIGLLLAQTYIGWSGRRLTMPLSREESRQRIHTSWMSYIALLLLAAGMMLFGVYEFVTELRLDRLTIVSSVLSFAGNVLVMTLIGTDAIIAGLHRFAGRRPLTREETARIDEAKRKLVEFCE